MKIFLVAVIVAGMLLLAGAAGAGYYFFRNLSLPEPPPPPAAPAQPPAPPPASTPSPEQAAPTIEEKVKSLAEAIAEVSATGESREVTLVFTEAEVNEQASLLLTQVETPEDIPLEIKSVHVDLQTGNNLLVEAETTAYGFDVTIKVKTQVAVSEGKPAVTIIDVTLGNPLLNALMKDRIIALLTEQIDDLLVQLTESGISGQNVYLEFKGISIQEEEMTVTAIIKPKE